MFDLKDVNINSRKYTNMVLSNIFELLKGDEKEETKDEVAQIDFDDLKRPDLLGMIKVMEGKPKGYTRWTNDKLIEFLKEVK